MDDPHGAILAKSQAQIKVACDTKGLVESLVAAEVGGSYTDAREIARDTTVVEKQLPAQL